MRKHSQISRLALVIFAAAAFALAPLAAAQDTATRRVLFLTKSSGYQHSVITRSKEEPDKPAHAEQILIDLGARNGFQVTVTKDASLFDKPETYATYDVFAFYTSGDLTRFSQADGAPGMSREGKAAFLKAIADGKGFIGFHSASDTFHSPGRERELLRPVDESPTVDPYIAMLGGEFTGHGNQQQATMRFVSNSFPGLENFKDFTMFEEWYGLKNLAPDMHVILVQDTWTMRNERGQAERDYARPPYPATWARMHGKGRVFYTSMGHREDVWTNPNFQQIITAGLNWVGGKTQFTPTPNMERHTPQPRQ